MKALGEEAQEAGRIMDQDTVDGARELKNEMDELKTKISSELTEAIIDNKDELLALVDFVTEKAIPAIAGLVRAMQDANELQNLVRNQELPEGTTVGEDYSGTDPSSTPGGTQMTDEEARRLYGTPPISGSNPTDNRPPFGSGTVSSSPEDSFELPPVKVTRDDDDNGGGSGGSSEAADRIADLQDEYQGLLQTLEQVSPAQQEFREAQDILNKALSAGAINQQQYNQGLAEARDRFAQAKFEASDLGQVMQTVENSMESAFMSMVDGTKSAEDAFKTMAASIIKELYRVLVVEQLVSSISGAVQGFFGGGSAPTTSPRPRLAPRASGGTVQAGQPYMTGESGRELFVPKTDGRILSPAQTSSMGGGGDAVTVNQTINVSTGVQQTVRTEIKSLMPQIAEGAKSAVVDAKLRGGSYGRSF